MALPAPFMRAIGRPASGWREIKPNLPSRFGRRPSPQRRRADLSIARAPSRATASRKLVILNSSGGGARRRFRRIGGDWRRAALVLERRQRALPEGDLVDASPAEMRVHPGHDHRRAVLRLERKGAFDPQHQGRGSGRRVGIAFGGPRRPLQLDRPGVTRKRFTDNGRPVGDQARLAQAARGQRLGDQSGSEFSQALGAAASGLHHRFGTESGTWGMRPSA